MATTPVDILLRVRDEASAKLREVAAETGGLVGTIQRLSAGLGLWGAISVGVTTLGTAAVASAKQMSDLVEQLDRASAITSIGMEPLQAMFKIIRDAGGDTEPLIKGLARFKREVADGNPIFKELGVTSGTVMDRFLQVAGILGRSSDEYKVAAAAQALFGKTGLQLIPDLKALADGTLPLMASMRGTGELITTKTAPAVRGLHDEMKTLGGDWRGAWNDMATAFVGPATGIMKILDGILNAFRAFGRSLHDMTFGVLSDLAQADAATSTFDERLAKAKEQARKVGGSVQVGVPSKDSRGASYGIEIKAPKVPDPLEAWRVQQQKERRERILSEAQLAREAFGEQREKELAEQRKAFIAETFKRDFIIPAAFGGGVVPLPGGPGRAIGQKPVDDPFKKVIDEWNKAANGITSSVAVLNDTLDSVWTGLREGFSQAFMGILSGSQSLSQAMRTVFTSLAQSILSTLGELVATNVFKLFLELVGLSLGVPVGLPGPISGVGMGGSAATAPSGPLIPAASFLGQRPLAGGGNTYIIQTFAPSSVLRDLVSPMGSMRRANDRLIEVARAS